MIARSCDALEEKTWHRGRLRDRGRGRGRGRVRGRDRLRVGTRGKDRPWR